jgi:hypothetical protein
MDTSLEPTDATAAAVPTVAGGANPATVYLARLTSAESRRAMATSLELLAELLVDGHPADRAQRGRRRRTGQPLAIAVPWHQLRYGHTQALRSWLAEHCSPAPRCPPGRAPRSLAPRPDERRGPRPSGGSCQRSGHEPARRPLRRRRRGPPPGRRLPGRRLARRPPRRRRAGHPVRRWLTTSRGRRP